MALVPQLARRHYFLITKYFIVSVCVLNYSHLPIQNSHQHRHLHIQHRKDKDMDKEMGEMIEDEVEEDKVVSNEPN